jgi:hypothetical protein
LPRSALTFNETGFERQGYHNDVLIWLTPKGDGLGLFHYPIPPDIHADLSNIDSVRAFFRRCASEVGLGVVEIDTVVIDGYTAVRTLFKAAQQPTGRTYFGALTFPFRDFSYVMKVQCEERGMTGVRDTVVSMTLIKLGEIVVDVESGRMTGWLDDPYDPTEVGPMTRNKSERPEYDAQFPDHPFSRARWVLNYLEHTVTIDEAVKRQPGFVWGG